MPESHRLQLERRLAAPPARVFAAFTDPALLARWWGPDGYSAPVVELDVREGGAYHTVMRSPEGTEHHLRGTYREVSPPSRLVFTWRWVTPQEDGRPDPDAPETVVTVALRPDGDGTALTLIHEAHPTDSAADAHRQGWTSSLDCLARVV